MQIFCMMPFLIFPQINWCTKLLAKQETLLLYWNGWYVRFLFSFSSKLETDLTEVRLWNFLQIKKFKVLKLLKDVFETGLKVEGNWYDDDEYQNFIISWLAIFL